MPLGSTEVPEELFMEMLEEIAPKFTVETYNVFEWNCNNFTNEVANIVLGHGIPQDIIDLPKEFLATPLGKSIAPMMQNMQNNLMQSSNQLFDTGAGNAGAGAGAGGMPAM